MRNKPQALNLLLNADSDVNIKDGDGVFIMILIGVLFIGLHIRKIKNFVKFYLNLVQILDSQIMKFLF